MVTGGVAGSGSGFGGSVDEDGVITDDRARENVDVHSRRVDRGFSVIAGSGEEDGVVTNGGSGSGENVEIHRRRIDGGVLRSFGRDENRVVANGRGGGIAGVEIDVEGRVVDSSLRARSIDEDAVRSDRLASSGESGGRFGSGRSGDSSRVGAGVDRESSLRVSSDDSDVDGGVVDLARLVDGPSGERIVSLLSFSDEVDVHGRPLNRLGESGRDGGGVDRVRSGLVGRFGEVVDVDLGRDEGRFDGNRDGESGRDEKEDGGGQDVECEHRSGVVE